MGILLTVIFVAVSITAFSALIGWCGFHGITWVLHQVIQRIRWMLKDDNKKGGE